ncbi:MAG TPA: pyridoxal phosphate-dependent aminotransferase, partial [Candidatus Acidoferrum sp.]|nr:pyridoxal phosphate-dependent aminotransferase [Candidatus Acidoferrum sp.]
MKRFSDRTGWNRVENALMEELRRRQGTGVPVLDLTRSNPTECGFRYDEALIRGAFTGEGLLRYQPDPKGLRAGREAVCKYYAGCGLGIGPDELFLTSGTSEGYSFLFRLLCNAGDEVLVPVPGYPLLDFLAELCDVKLRPYALVYDHGWQMDMGALVAATTERTKAVVVVHPNNPTGHYTAAGERGRLAEFCAQRGIAIIADEVFLDFALEANGGEKRRSFATEGEALTFVLSGISKICGLPQMKLAWIVVNGPK